MYKWAIKNHHQEIQLITNRVIIALIFIALLLSTLIGRLAYLQVYKNRLYTTLSTQNAIDLVPIEPARGMIYDRNGVILAENIPVFSLDVIPYQAANMQTSLNEVKKLVDLTDNDLSQFQK